MKIQRKRENKSKPAEVDRARKGSVVEPVKVIREGHQRMAQAEKSRKGLGLSSARRPLASKSTARQEYDTDATVNAENDREVKAALGTLDKSLLGISKKLHLGKENGQAEVAGKALPAARSRPMTQPPSAPSKRLRPSGGEQMEIEAKSPAARSRMIPQSRPSTSKDGKEQVKGETRPPMPYRQAARAASIPAARRILSPVKEKAHYSWSDFPTKNMPIPMEKAHPAGRSKGVARTQAETRGRPAGSAHLAKRSNALGRSHTTLAQNHPVDNTRQMSGRIYSLEEDQGAETTEQSTVRSQTSRGFRTESTTRRTKSLVKPGMSFAAALSYKRTTDVSSLTDAQEHFSRLPAKKDPAQRRMHPRGSVKDRKAMNEYRREYKLSSTQNKKPHFDHEE